MADAVLTKAVDLAREAAQEAAEDAAMVGAHLGATEHDGQYATHLFSCALPGYRGWVWSVTLTRVPRAKEATVCETALVPADDALLAPAWVPWAERVRPGDLDAQMVLPFIAEDPRLVPGYEAVGDDDADRMALWEWGLGRERVLGVTGRDQAAERWYRGAHGPSAPSALVAPAPCSTCAFLVPLGGSLRTLFGVCANEWSPSDGSVVSADHGCGAHSQTDAERTATRWPDDDPVVDTAAVAPLDLSSPDTAPEPAETIDQGQDAEPALDEPEPAAE